MNYIHIYIMIYVYEYIYIYIYVYETKVTGILYKPKEKQGTSMRTRKFKFSF